MCFVIVLCILTMSVSLAQLFTIATFWPMMATKFVNNCRSHWTKFTSYYFWCFYFKATFLLNIPLVLCIRRARKVAAVRSSLRQIYNWWLPINQFKLNATKLLLSAINLFIIPRMSNLWHSIRCYIYTWNNNNKAEYLHKNVSSLR